MKKSVICIVKQVFEKEYKCYKFMAKTHRLAYGMKATFSLIEISDCLYFCQKLLNLMTFLIHLSLFYYVYNKLFFKCRY